MNPLVRGRVLRGRSSYTAGEQVRVSPLQPITVLLVVLVAGSACCLATRAGTRRDAPKGAVQVGRMPQDEAVRRSGEVLLEVLPNLSGCSLTTESVALKGGLGAAWDVSCTDSQGVERATVVWDAMTGHVSAIGTSQVGQTGGRPVRGTSAASQLSDQWMKLMARYGWQGPWQLRRVVWTGDKAWRADYSAGATDAYIMINAHTGRLMQAHLSPHRRQPHQSVSNSGKNTLGMRPRVFA